MKEIDLIKHSAALREALLYTEGSLVTWKSRGLTYYGRIAIVILPGQIPTREFIESRGIDLNDFRTWHLETTTPRDTISYLVCQDPNKKEGKCRFMWPKKVESTTELHHLYEASNVPMFGLPLLLDSLGMIDRTLYKNLIDSTFDSEEVAVKILRMFGCIEYLRFYYDNLKNMIDDYIRKMD